jgi:hypothetical protein
MRSLTLFSLLAASALAQSLQPPQVGFALAADRTVRPVFGVAGNFVLGPSIAADALSQAFSRSLGLLKTDTTLSAFDSAGRVIATTQVATGPALFAFSPDGLSALAYVASENTLIEFRSGRFEMLPFRPETAVIAIAFQATLLYQREEGIIEIRVPLGHIHPSSRTVLTGVTAPVLPLSSGAFVFSDAKGIVLRQPDGSETHIAARLPAKFSLQQMSADWIQLSDSMTGRRFAIRITPGREAFYQLPEAGK